MDHLKVFVLISSIFYISSSNRLNLPFLSFSPPCVEPPRPSQKLLRLLEMTPHVPSPSKPDNNTESLIEESEQPSVENPPCEPQTQIEKSFAPNKSNCNAGSNVPATHLARRSSDCNIVPPSQLLAPPPPPPPKSQTRAIHSARLPLQASQISNLTPASAVQPKTHYSGSSNSSNMHSQETVKVGGCFWDR